MGQTIAAIFDDRSDAENAAHELRSAGFRDNDIGFTMKDDRASGAGSSGGSADESTHEHPVASGPNQAASVAGKGALTGTVVGGLLGAAATALIPGIGPVVAGGILAGIATGALTGAAAGGIAGALVGVGIPEDEARYYEGEVAHGSTLVTVNAGDRAMEARRILEGAGGRLGIGESHSAEDHQRMSLKKEQVQVNKSSEQTGEMRVGKRVVTEQKTIEVPVEKEEAFIERRPVADRPTTGRIGDGQEITVPLREERAEVTKRPVVTEEISVGKRSVQENQTIQTDVKREEAVINEDEEAGTR